MVENPDILRECNENEYVIIISTKNFANEIEKQIKEDYNLNSPSNYNEEYI